jgi:hypothetical protein
VAEPADRNFWESTRGSKKMLALTDSLLPLVTTVEPKAILKYNRHYIGLDVNGSPLNFVTFRPRRAHLIVTIKLPQSKETDESLEEAGIETMPYRSRWNQYRLRLVDNLDNKQREAILKLIKRARESFGKTIE